MHLLIISSEPFVIPSVPLGGIFQLHQAQALRAHGHHVGVLSGGLLPLRDLFSFNYPPIVERSNSDVIVRVFRKSVAPLRFLPEEYIHATNVKCILEAADVYVKAKGKPDCIHAHNLQYAGISAQLLSSRLKVPYVITEHSSSFVMGTYPRALLARFRSAISKSAGNVAVSASLASTLGNLFEGSGPSFSVVPNVIDPQLLKFKVPARPHEGYRFLSIGRLDANKNHALLISAFANAFKGAAVFLRIGGAGQESLRLKRLAHELEIDAQVSLLGMLSREGVAVELKSADCLVLPSRMETFGVVAIEALAFGTPIVATPSGGPDRIVSNMNGILTADHSVRAMEVALRRMYEERSRFGREQIQTEALRLYSDAAFVDRIVRIYSRAIETR